VGAGCSGAWVCRVIDVIVVGSGAAGTWAAWQASQEGLSVLVLDVGLRPPAVPPLRGHLLDLRRSDPRQAEYLIGSGFESLHNVAGAYQSPKLNSPRFRFVTERAAVFGALRGEGFSAVQSFARGGLAEAWGAGAYRFTGDDLRRFPLPAGCLEPFYDELTRRIGIAGSEDDLVGHFGSARDLQPPLSLDRLASRLLASYERRRDRFRAEGFTIGRPRLAVLSRPLGERPACPYDNLTFWQPQLGYLYVPSLTLDALVAERRIEYRERKLVLRFREGEGHVEVLARDTAGGADETYRARRLVLAAGALNSARLVLRSHDDFETTLPLLDNQPSMVPFLHAGSVGESPDSSSHGLGQLNIVHQPPEGLDYVQGTYYTYNGLLASEVIIDFPLPARSAVAACRYLLPAFSVVTFFYPDEPRAGNFVRLCPDGSLLASYRQPVKTGGVERRFIRLMAGSGFLSHPTVVKVPAPGSGIHYAGTLPMQGERSLKHCTDPSGRLHGSRAVYVADASVFPTLPAKNHALTLMANAMRVARAVAASIRGAA